MGIRSPLLKSYGDDFAWSLLDATPDATLIVAGTGEIVFVNDHAGVLFGFDLEDLLGRVVDDLLPEALRAVHRAHRTRFRAEPTVRAMGAGQELLARRADGSEFPVEISLSPLHLDDDVFGVAAVRDVTERVAGEDQLHRVLRALDATDDGVFIFDTVTLRFSFVNDGAVRLVGYQRDELLTMTPLHLNPYTTESEYRRLIDELFADGASSLVPQSILLAKDGSEVPVETTLHSATSGRDESPSVITLARDITRRLAAETELRHSQDALHQAEQVLAVAEDRERIARDLHDTVIQRLFAEGLSLQAAMAGVGDPQRTRARLESAVDGLDQTIRELRMAVFSLQGAVSAPGGLRGRLLQVVTEATDGLGFEPRLQFDGPIETVDVRIADQLTPVLREALSNITHHAHAGHVRVAVSVADNVTLTVSDDGIGVPAEVLGGRGVTNMAERARALRGDFTISPEPSGGSLLVWEVPAQRSRQPALPTPRPAGASARTMCAGEYEIAERRRNTSLTPPSRGSARLTANGHVSIGITLFRGRPVRLRGGSLDGQLWKAPAELSSALRVTVERGDRRWSELYLSADMSDVDDEDDRSPPCSSSRARSCLFGHCLAGANGLPLG